MAASSGLRENVYPIIFFVKMFIYIILLYYYNNWHRWWNQCLMLFFFLFQVQMLLPDVYFILFYFVFIMFVFLILCLYRCYNANYVYSLVSSLISLPHLCTDAVVLGIMTFVCTDVMVQGYYLFIFSSRMDCNMPSQSVAGCISQCFCSMQDCLLWCIWPPLLLLPYCGLPCLLF